MSFVSNNMKDTLFTLAVCVGVLAIAGIAYLIKQHKEKQKIEKAKQKQQEQGKDVAANNITKLHRNDGKW